MKKILNILFFIVLFAGSSFAETAIDIPVFRDGVMDSENEGGDSTFWNYLANPRLGYDQGNDRHYRGWLSFDLSSIPSIPEGQTILSAEVRMKLSTRIASHVDCVDVPDTNQLGESVTTWNNPPILGDTLQTNVWLAPGDAGDANTWVLKFDTQAVSDAVKANYDAGESHWGCVIEERSDEDGYALWYARENITDVPILHITVGPIPPVDSISPTDDNWVRDTDPDLNAGFQRTLRVGYDEPQGGHYYSFLKFDLSGITDSNFAFARLYLHKATGNDSIDLGVYEVTDDNWTEDTITWSNKPAIGALLADYGSTDSGNCIAASAMLYSIDVADSVKASLRAADNLWSIALKDIPGTTNVTTYSTVESKETITIGFEPYLQIFYDPNACTDLAIDDFNGDCMVNFADFAIFAQDWLSQSQ